MIETLGCEYRYLYGYGNFNIALSTKISTSDFHRFTLQNRIWIQLIYKTLENRNKKYMIWLLSYIKRTENNFYHKVRCLKIDNLFICNKIVKKNL